MGFLESPGEVPTNLNFPRSFPVNDDAIIPPGAAYADKNTS